MASVITLSGLVAIIGSGGNGNGNGNGPGEKAGILQFNPTSYQVVEGSDTSVTLTVSLRRCYSKHVLVT